MKNQTLTCESPNVDAGRTEVMYEAVQSLLESQGGEGRGRGRAKELG